MNLAKGRWARDHRGLSSLSRLPLPVNPVYVSGNPHFPAARFFGVNRYDFLHSFISIYGTRVLNVTYVDWLMNQRGDLAQHFLGWVFFRNEPWSFPLGVIKSIGYPFEISIVFTDSIPLFALFFKLLNPILPNHFQYFGIWGIISFALQGGIASLIFRKYTDKYVIIGISSLFLIFSPIMIFRMFFHTALAGHWILLLAIAAWVFRDRIHKHIILEIVLWAAICSISVMIHPYFTAMVFVMLAGYLFHDYLNYRRIKKNLYVLAASCVSIISFFWLIGGFVRANNVDFDEAGLGHYSLNGNAFFNPQWGWSRFLKELPVATSGQYEGFMYLGLGTILLVLLNLCMFALNNLALHQT